MKTYLVEFTLTSGDVEKVELTTDRLEWSIEQWCRNRSVTAHKVLSESPINTKGLLLG